MKQPGRIIYIGPTQNISPTFSKAEFVIETNEQYPQKILFEMHGSNINQLDGKFVNQNVSIDFNLRGREWTNPQGETKYFNTLVAWNIQPI